MESGSPPSVVEGVCVGIDLQPYQAMYVVLPKSLHLSRPQFQHL